MAHYLCCLFYDKCLGMLQGVILESENKPYSSSSDNVEVLQQVIVRLTMLK
jgi:hypothetical protein